MSYMQIVVGAQTYEEVMSKFVDSVQTLLDDIKKDQKKLKKLKETDRTKAHYTKKMIRKWFIENGGL